MMLMNTELPGSWYAGPKESLVQSTALGLKALTTPRSRFRDSDNYILSLSNSPTSDHVGVGRAYLRAKRKSGSVKFLSNEKEYTILSLFLWVEGGEKV